MIEVKDLDAREMHRFYGRHLFEPLKGYAARRGIRTVALGGLATGDDGRVWGFIDFRPGYRLKAIYKYMRKILDWAAEQELPEIWVARDKSFETSERLLTRAGFSLADEQIENFEIWVWRNQKVKNNVGS